MIGDKPLVNPYCSSDIFVRFNFSRRQYSNNFPMTAVTVYRCNCLQDNLESLSFFNTGVNIPVLNAAGTDFDFRILLNNGVIYSDSMSLPYLKCSAHKPYSSGDFPLFNFRTEVSTSGTVNIISFKFSSFG